FVPASAYASVESSDRTHSWTLAPVAAVKARRCPSGDTAMRPKLVLLGASSASFVIRSTSGWRLKYLHAKPRTSTSNAAAVSHANLALPNIILFLVFGRLSVSPSNSRLGREPG